mmetsp:Transcript_24425/g.40748  ORF Transcript_24425/g.40748 Transcript_24425/m.40748 type:complete len:110 (-) Transcript_24425:218-547(-)
MQAFLLVLVAFVATASAFMPHRAIKTSGSSLSMKMDLPKVAIPAAMVPFVAPAMTIAAEGTGRAFGIDDGRLVWAALLPSLIIFPLYNKWSSDQEGDDFFDGYEKRRNG